MPSRARLFATLALTRALVACNTLPEPTRLPWAETRQRAIEHIELRSTPPVEVSPVPPSALSTRRAREQPRGGLANARVSIRFPLGPGTLDDLVTALDAQKIRVVFRWDQQENEGLLERRLPFTRYEG